MSRLYRPAHRDLQRTETPPEPEWKQSDLARDVLPRRGRS
jgi:hypothetical protein